MKKKLVAVCAIALLASACLGAAAYALDDVPKFFLNEPPLPVVPSGLELRMDVSIAGKAGNRYVAGDMLILTASATNNSAYPVSGELCMSCPGDIGTPVAVPAVESFSNWPCCPRCPVTDLAPGETVELVLVVRALDSPKASDWDAAATFYIKDGGGACAVVADAHFGTPKLKADRNSILKDGVIRVRNEGNGGASRIKFQFLAKKGWQTPKGLPDYAKYIGDGWIEIDLGGLVAGGAIEKDVSGLLHQRMDKLNSFEIVYETDLDGPLSAVEWDEA